MLVDSNIIVYAINTASPKHLKAQKFLKENSGNLEIAHQNFLEALRVLTHPKFPSPMKVKNAIEAIENIIEKSVIITPSYITRELAIELIREYRLKSDQVFDAYLVATALSNGINIIATDNVRDLGKFEGIKIVNPFTAKQID